jgi:hypothetical protein
VFVRVAVHLLFYIYIYICVCVCVCVCKKCYNLLYCLGLYSVPEFFYISVSWFLYFVYDVPHVQNVAVLIVFRWCTCCYLKLYEGIETDYTQRNCRGF